jgi:LemA protein
VLLWALWTYNAFVRLHHRVREAFAGVDVQLKRRHDLVQNLVATVSAYARHEREALEEVTRARGAAAEAGRVEEKERTEAGLSRSLARLIALVERYPDLKADEGFRRLQADLVELEDHLQYARRYYNGTVRNLNTRYQQLPSSLLAALLRRRPEPYFQLDADGERAAPRVSVG